MSCDDIKLRNGRDGKKKRLQYPDYITYLKNREADKFFNKAVVLSEDGELQDMEKNIKKAVHLNQYDIEAKRLWGEKASGCILKPTLDTDKSTTCSIKGIKMD